MTPPIALRVATRFTLRTANTLQWGPAPPIHHWMDPPDNQLQAIAPNGWRYLIYFSEFYTTVEFYKNGPYRRTSLLTKEGIEQRSGKKTLLDSLETAKAAAERHYALASAPKETDPARLAPMLTKDQKAFILEAFQNGGQLYPEYGTDSERPIRIRRTRLLRQLVPIDVFTLRGDLTTLGLEVAKILAKP